MGYKFESQFVRAWRIITYAGSPTVGSAVSDRRRSQRQLIMIAASSFIVLAGEKIGWEAGTRTPIARFRVWSPTIGRPPSSEIEFTSATPPKSNHVHYRESTVSRPAHALAFSAAFCTRDACVPVMSHNSLRTCALAISKRSEIVLAPQRDNQQNEVAASSRVCRRFTLVDSKNFFAD